MIQSPRKRLTIIAVAAVVIVVAIVSAWSYNAGPAGREDFILKIKRVALYGAIAGASYALLSVGFTLSYGVTEVVNMGYGALFMIGTYLFFVFGPIGWYLHLPMLQALILATVLAGIVGIIVYRLSIHPVVDDPLAPIVTTIGVAVIAQQLMLLIFSTELRSIRFYESIHQQPPAYHFFDMAVPYPRFWVFVISLVFFAGLWLFVTKAKVGGAMRAIAQDREVAMLMGINTERVYMITMAISASLAALAGILILGSNWETAYPYMWTRPLITSFAVVILGGLGSIKGSLLGSFIIGFTELVVITFHPEGGSITGAIYVAIMVLVLVLRPKGLFGKRVELE